MNSNTDKELSPVPVTLLVLKNTMILMIWVCLVTGLVVGEKMCYE